MRPSTITLHSNEPPRLPGNPHYLTLLVRNDQIPAYVGPEDILVFRNGLEVLECKFPLDAVDDFPCVSERLRIADTGDIKLTVATLLPFVFDLAVA